MLRACPIATRTRVSGFDATFHILHVASTLTVFLPAVADANARKTARSLKALDANLRPLSPAPQVAQVRYKEMWLPRSSPSKCKYRLLIEEIRERSDYYEVLDEDETLELLPLAAGVVKDKVLEEDAPPIFIAHADSELRRNMCRNM